MGRFIKSFGYAFSGLGYSFKSQFNFKIHVFALVVVSIAGWWFKLSVSEWLWIIAASGLVLMAELFNTAIEVLVDLVSPEIHPKAKIIKDAAAAAVLMIAIAAVIIGLIIFVPKIFNCAT
ncbi:MAG: diacylglycerol kinase family protein [Candidatus Pedobacter colombiensis]|uniref:Diacylglycerol kinase family protein n=1 Tax=Candidatus Pedobacter colombiensis TaxID=3121371 RepID=A0AAJ5W9T0_9SPHI|nr:diacylglycerol kinase family protein [Pedobacter sp.]WEK19751.1 MAG: diacylglycerol kinase family protein [Pedobacter sp.]